MNEVERKRERICGDRGCLRGSIDWLVAWLEKVGVAATTLGVYEPQHSRVSFSLSLLLSPAFTFSLHLGCTLFPSDYPAHPRHRFTP